MKHIALMALMENSPRIHGELKELVGEDFILTDRNNVPLLTDRGTVIDILDPEEGLTFVVCPIIFTALQGIRDDVCMFDPDKTITDEDGFNESQGGLIFSRKV